MRRIENAKFCTTYRPITEHIIHNTGVDNETALVLSTVLTTLFMLDYDSTYLNSVATIIGLTPVQTYKNIFFLTQNGYLDFNNGKIFVPLTMREGQVENLITVNMDEEYIKELKEVSDKFGVFEAKRIVRTSKDVVPSTNAKEKTVRCISCGERYPVNLYTECPQCHVKLQIKR